MAAVVYGGSIYNAVVMHSVLFFPAEVHVQCPGRCIVNLTSVGQLVPEGSES